MRVLNVSHLADTGGNGWRTVQAFAKHAPGWHYRFACRQTNYLQYPTDLPWEQAAREWQRADVVHVRDGFQAQRLLVVDGRPTVIHHHGTQFRLYRDRLLREQRSRRAVGLAATLDLWLMAPDDLVWAPALYDLDALAALRVRRDDGVLRIAHAPTNRYVKSTDAFLGAVNRLAEQIPVEIILVERTSWAECIRRKAEADIYFDQVALGYGNNAIEAWAMGIPVIAGAEPETLAEMQRRFGQLPFYLATEATIYDALVKFTSPILRDSWGQLGRRHAERWHSERAGVAFLQGIYERAAGRLAA